MYPPNQGGMRTTDRGSTTGAASWTDDELARRLPEGRAQRIPPPHRHILYKINNLQRNFGFTLHKMLHKEARVNGLFLHLNSAIFRCFPRLNFLKSPASASSFSITLFSQPPKSVDYPCAKPPHPLPHNNLNGIWLFHWTLQVLAFSHPFPSRSFYVLYLPFIVICQ